jgi:DNA ligase (NAD+)
MLTVHFRSLAALAEASEETLAGIETSAPLRRGASVPGSPIRTTQRWSRSSAAPVCVWKPNSHRCTGRRAFTGLTFVITGTLSQPREDVKAWITALGGKVTDTVSQKTSYVIVGNDPGGTKFNKAQQLAIPMLDEAALQRMAESKP